jgi:hypothetical protein
VSAIPEVLDALVSVWRNTPDLAGLRPDQIFDGPPATYVGTEGVAVGASIRDESVEFTYPAAGLDSTGDRFTISCLAWSGSGDTRMKTHRDRVDAILDALESHLDQDRTLGGVVDTAWIVAGSFTQEQNRGALVTAEFRIQARRF